MSSVQEELISQGWCIETPEGCELSEKYGVKPIYGIQDNYFDIHIGTGFSVAIKIMNASTGKCIRYVYVPEGETVTVGQILQGVYFLKLAYGRDWMEMQTDDGVIGKFTRGSFYEKSTSNYNFGEKNYRILSIICLKSMWLMVIQSMNLKLLKSLKRNLV